VQKGEDGKVNIEGGKRLIWAKDIPEFYSLFVAKARQIDKCVEELQYAMDNVTDDGKGNTVASVKSMDRTNAGDAWDESAYPKDLRLTTGVAKERHPNGEVKEGDDGLPIYVIHFSEYHVSEKLPELLRERAIKRIDESLSATIDTAMTYAFTELSDQMLTFLGELTPRIKLYPPVDKSHGYLYDSDVVKRLTSADDPSVPAGCVKVLARYQEKDSDTKSTIWLGPMKEEVFAGTFYPSVSSEKKKIYPSVVENIVEQLTVFRDKKAKMLGKYGENAVKTLEPLLETLTAAKKANVYLSTTTAAKQLVDAVKQDAQLKETIASVITNTVSQLESQLTEVRATHKRRRALRSLADKQPA
jgi:hypothetical protein